MSQVTKSLLRGINAENNVYIEPFSLDQPDSTQSDNQLNNSLASQPKDGSEHGSGSSKSESIIHSQAKSKSNRSSSKRAQSKTSGKRQNEFTKIFQAELPQEERLIADFSCALVRDILVQGRLYLTENYCCFHSTILRWETSAIIPYVDITHISKERTVKIIPNAISVHCNQNKYIFTSFTARDRALVIFKELWKLALNQKEKNLVAEPESMEGGGGADTTTMSTGDDLEDNIEERISNTSQHSEENDLEPAPLYAEDKNSKVYLDAEFPVPVDTLFSLVWLPSSPFWSAFMNIRKTRQWTCDEWSNESSGKITRECRCIQHIQLPMGSTKDVPQVDEHTLVLSENSKRIVVDARTYIRDVPYGDSFHTLNRWQFLRSSKPNTTRLRVSTTVCYEKQCWQIVRGFIEKGAYEGNCTFMNELREELSRFIQNGSVSSEIGQIGGQSVTGQSNDPTGPPLDESQRRQRSESKISVRPSNIALNQAEATNLLEQQEQTMSHLPSGTGIDHLGAFQHWMLWLFFFFIGVILFSNWSLHSRLSQIESKLGLANHSPLDESSITTELPSKSLSEISEILRLLLAEVKSLRESSSSHQEL